MYFPYHGRKLSILFICIGNAHRSQLGEAFARHYGWDVFHNVHSAGTIPFSGDKWGSHYFRVAASEAKHKGMNLDWQYPKNLNTVYGHFDIVILMGKDVHVQHYPITYSHLEHWDIKRYDTRRHITNNIQDGVLNLIWRIKNGQYR